MAIVDTSGKALTLADAQHDRENNDLHDVHEQGLRVDGHPFAGKERHQGRGNKRRDHRGNRCNGDAERDITFCQEGHDVGCGSARTAANQDDADGDVGRKVKRDRQQISSAGHDDVVPDHTNGDVSGPAEYFPKIRRR
jgi:hypothetical protein